MDTTMMYDDDLECWVVELNGRTYALHCGEYFELIVGQERIACRLELDSEWYIIIDEMRFNLRGKNVYKVVI